MAHSRVVQWATMARTWWLYDAKFQCPYRSAEKICMYLEGRHKPLFHPLSDIGDNVVVINTRHVAMVEDLWRKELYAHDTRYAHGKSKTSAWRLHEEDPTKIIYKAVYFAAPKSLSRRTFMRRLHLYPDEEVPAEILGNVSDVIRQIQIVPKKLEEYSEEELSKFPKVFDWPKDHVMFKRKSLEETLVDIEKAKKEAASKKKK